MKKGFTIIELLAVIIVISIIAITATQVILVTIEKARLDTFHTNEEILTRSVEPYISSKYFTMPTDNNSSIFISLYDLKQKKMVKNILDPKSKAPCNDIASGILVTKNSEGKYDYVAYLKCANYSSTTPNSVSDYSIVYNGTTSATVTINLNADSRSIITPTQNIGIVRPTLLDYTTWVLGSSGSQTGFNRNGTVSESQMVLKNNPWGVSDVTWAALTNDATSDDDGGWSSPGISINKTKKYRLSVWMRRENTGTGCGNTYFGTLWGEVANLSDGSTNNNPYFAAAGCASYPQLVDNWLLFVAYVHPYDYTLTTADPSSGIYNPITQTKLYSLGDFKWTPTATVGNHRTYLFYSTKTDERMYWYRPRFEMAEGQEPTINELLMGYENSNVNGYAAINKTGIITYTFTANGTYNFIVKNKTGNSTTYSYVITGIV